MEQIWSGFSGGWNLALGSGNRRVQEKNRASEVFGNMGFVAVIAGSQNKGLISPKQGGGLYCTEVWPKCQRLSVSRR
jgi:hypothetical protein